MQYNVKAGTVVHIQGLPFALVADTLMEGNNIMPARVQVGFVPPPGPDAPPDVRHLHNPVA